MGICLAMSRTGWAASMMAVALLGPFPLARSALADSPARGQTEEIGSTSVVNSSKRSRPGKAPARKPPGKSDGAGSFVYGLINQIRSQSEALCARYGNPSDCLEEAEVCLTMRDADDNQVKLCLNTIPGESGGDGSTVQKSRLKP